MERPQFADGGDGLYIWRVTANILNKQSRTADKCVPAAWWLCVRLAIYRKNELVKETSSIMHSTKNDDLAAKFKTAMPTEAQVPFTAAWLSCLYLLRAMTST
jgi:hypothetical protein